MQQAKALASSNVSRSKTHDSNWTTFVTFAQEIGINPMMTALDNKQRADEVRLGNMVFDNLVVKSENWF